MKKAFLMFAVSVLFLQLTYAQKTRAGVMGGATFSKMSGELGGNENGYQTKVGYTIGFLIDAPINAKFSFAPGLHYVQKGTLQRPPAGTLITKSYIALRYAEFNANFIYKASGTKGNFFAGAGPSIDMNLPSKKGTMIEKDKTETDIVFGKTIEKDLAGIDYGVNLLLGYRLNCGFFASVNYNRGFRDLRPVDASGPEQINNSYFGIQIGWLFQNKETK